MEIIAFSFLSLDLLILRALRADERYRYYRLSPRGKKLLLEAMQDILEREGVTLAIIFGKFLELESFRGIDIAIHGKGLAERLAQNLLEI